jgi:hypothetical protein
MAPDDAGPLIWRHEVAGAVVAVQISATIAKALPQDAVEGGAAVLRNMHVDNHA